MENKIIFAKGLFWRKKEEKAPENLRGKLSINVKDFMKFAEDNKQHLSEKGWLNFGLWRSSKDENNYYFSLDTWKPKEKTADLQPVEEEKIDESLIPF